MTDYNDGNWHGWNGGECPVHPKTIVQIVWQFTHGDVRDGLQEDCAVQWAWGGNENGRIIAFRVVKQHREPREYWIWTDSRGVVQALDYDHPGSVHVREVLE